MDREDTESVWSLRCWQELRMRAEPLNCSHQTEPGCTFQHGVEPRGASFWPNATLLHQGGPPWPVGWHLDADTGSGILEETETEMEEFTVYL